MAELKGISTQLREKREKLSLSLRTAAIQIGVSPVTLMRIEKGEQDPSNETLGLISKWLEDPSITEDFVLPTVEAHLRAEKNLPSEVADTLVTMFQKAISQRWKVSSVSTRKKLSPVVVGELSTSLTGYIRQIEYLAKAIRKMWGIVNEDHPFDPEELAEGLGLIVVSPDEVKKLAPEDKHLLLEVYSDKWSAGTITINDGRRVVIINPRHTKERFRATLMEEVCHVLFDHHPTLISTHRASGQAFRDYNKEQEKEAYWVGAAVLMPYEPLAKAIRKRDSVIDIASKYLVSEELVKFRIKVTGLWSCYAGNK